MKRAWLVACALILSSVPAFAEAPKEAPIDLAAIFAPLPAPGSCAVASGDPLAANDRARTSAVPKSACTATAHCGTSPSVSCGGSSSSGTSGCSSVDQNCAAGIRGGATCAGITTSCPACPVCNLCCQCAATGDCFKCCRCDGGTFGQCINACGGA